MTTPEEAERRARIEEAKRLGGAYDHDRRVARAASMAYGGGRHQVIVLADIKAGDEVRVEDATHNKATGVVFLVASQPNSRWAENDTLAVSAFGVLIPFAKRSRQGNWSHTGGNTVIEHQGPMI